jgi:hypothetical protein
MTGDPYKAPSIRTFGSLAELTADTGIPTGAKTPTSTSDYTIHGSPTDFNTPTS